MSRWIPRALTVVALAVVVRASAPAEETEETDGVELAAMLVGDGHWDRAERVLAEVDPTSRRVPKARFYTLRGLVRAHAQNHVEAIADFEAALKEEDVDQLVHLHLAQSLLATGNAARALTELDAAGEAGAAMSGTWLLRSRAEKDTGDVKGAWAALDAGEVRFPAELEFGRQKVYLLVELGLYQEAVSTGRAWLARQPGERGAWLALAEAMRNAGQAKEAIGLLEDARLRFPDSVDIATQLARLYLQTGHPAIAADLLAVAGEVKPSLFTAAAEAARQAGKLERALYLNGRVPDPTEKARQRLGLYVEGADWSRALALDERLDRLGLGTDDGVRYALAYAAFQLGDVDTAETHLTGIADPRVFRDATELREAMSACRGTAGGCP